MAAYTFEVFVDGDGGTGIAEVLRRLCRERTGDEAEVAVYDVHADPEAAERRNIVATPTVVRTDRVPERRVLGRLDDLEAVATALGLVRGEG